MKLLSTYCSDDDRKKAEVFHVNDYTYRVVVKADTGTHYSSTFVDEETADNFAESWVL